MSEAQERAWRVHACLHQPTEPRSAGAPHVGLLILQHGVCRSAMRGWPYCSSSPGWNAWTWRDARA